MLTAQDVANYFLSLSDRDEGDLISNLKIQKLVYYAQGFSLAVLNQPLFAEPIEAWQHGPVVPILYQAYKKYGTNALPTDNISLADFSQEQKELLDEVYDVYGQYSAWKLRDMTHEESPWRLSYVSGKNQLISHALLTEYFKTQIN